MELDGSVFVGNRARDAGLAVQSLGIAGNITDTTFESNTYHCSSGQYGYEYEIDEYEDEVIVLLIPRHPPLVASYCSPLHFESRAEHSSTCMNAVGDTIMSCQVPPHMALSLAHW